MSGDVIRVLLADDHAVVRAGLKAVLGGAKDIAVVGEAGNGREAVDAALRLNPDVVVMDLSMDEMDGVAATRELKSRASASRVLILTMHAEDEYLVPLLEAGASGYLVKNAADRDLVDAVRTVAGGQQYLQASGLGPRCPCREGEHGDGAEHERVGRREWSHGCNVDVAAPGVCRVKPVPIGGQTRTYWRPIPD